MTPTQHDDKNAPTGTSDEQKKLLNVVHALAATMEELIPPLAQELSTNSIAWFTLTLGFAMGARTTASLSILLDDSLDRAGIMKSILARSAEEYYEVAALAAAEVKHEASGVDLMTCLNEVVAMVPQPE